MPIIPVEKIGESWKISKLLTNKLILKKWNDWKSKRLRTTRVQVSPHERTTAKPNIDKCIVYSESTFERAN